MRARPILHTMLGAIALALVLAACESGKPCKQRSDCAEGYVCAGFNQMKCQRCSDLQLCKKSGQCSYRDGRCVAGSNADCKQSDDCTIDDRCIASQGSCISEHGTRAKGEEGCPCGCDHSEEMVAELEAEGATALSTIAETLDIIADREDAGYITEAMVQHRLRLLALARRLHRPMARRHPSPRTLALRGARAELPIVTSSTLAVRSQLIAHGQQTEIVRGKPKLQRACFRWWLELENLGDAPLTLPLPELRGNVHFAPSRWYLEDGDGQPFAGVMAPHEKKAVLVIGYLGEPVEPGTDLDAEMRIGTLTLQASARARHRWDGDG